jgi:hypothetical protein
MDLQTLVDAIKRSGGGQNALDEADGLLARTNLLERTGRYGALLSQLARANDKSNFLALVLETNFAYRFESEGRELTYEVSQGPDQHSSIDFLRALSPNDKVFFELRLLQQTQSIADDIRHQIEQSPVYSVAMDGHGERREILRIQSVILSKVQDKNGKPTKFFSTAADAVNIVVIDASDTLLGTVDVHDCLLATHGDPSVEDVYQRGVFGIFQDDKPEYPQPIHDIASNFAHAKQTLHGVLFVFRVPRSALLTYQIEQVLVWNPSRISPTRAREILSDVTAAIPQRIMTGAVPGDSSLARVTSQRVSPSRPPPIGIDYVPERIAKRPVRIAERLGVHCASTLKLVSRIASLASWSTRGVGAPRVIPPPYVPGSPYPRLSIRMKTMLGLS